MTLENALITVEYTAKVKDSDEIFETTLEEDAKKSQAYDSAKLYRPKLVSVGSSWVLRGFDEALADAQVGTKFTVEVPPEKGIGGRDNKKVRIIPLRKLGEDAEKVSVGDTVTIDNRKGRIVYIGSGRVKMDYNHRFAGKTLVYEATVLKRLEDPSEIVQEILYRHMQADASGITPGINDGAITIDVPAKIFEHESLSRMKRLIRTDIFKHMPETKKLVFTETFLNKTAESAKPEPSSQEKSPSQEKPPKLSA